MEHLVAKWKIWYKSLDVNHDGKISIEDVEESRSKFTELHKILGDKAAKVKTDMEAWWKQYIFSHSTDAEVSEAQFVDSLTKKFNADKAAFDKEMTECFKKIFDVIDTNQDKSIQEDEFVLAFQAFGHENEPVLRKAFKLFDAKDEIPIGVIVNAWVQFVSCPDASKTDVIKKAFDDGL